MAMNSAGMEGMMGLGSGHAEWLIVFPHLPADRIAKIRLTWHPYAWVIFRNVSLELDHKTTPTAELYIDQSKPGVLPNDAEIPKPATPGVLPPQGFYRRPLSGVRRPEGCSGPQRFFPIFSPSRLRAGLVSNGSRWTLMIVNASSLAIAAFID